MPSWSSAQGGSEVIVFARNLAPTSHLACHFDEVGPTYYGSTYFGPTYSLTYALTYWLTN